MTEDRNTRLKRLKMRSWRRGTKEMDMILGPFSEGPLRQLSDADIDIYEQFLDENDHLLYKWVSGQTPTPSEFVSLVSLISAELTPR